MRIFPLPAIALVLLAQASFADVIDVGGPSPDATTVAQAIGMANDGDVIRVYSGSYSDAVIDGKSLSLIGIGAVELNLIAIRNLGAHQSVELQDLGIEHYNYFCGLTLANCLGSIRISDCHFRGLQQVILCEDVALVNSTLQGYGGTYGNINFPTGNGDPGLLVDNSDVALYRSSIRGGPGGVALPPDHCLYGSVDGGDGAPGVLVRGSGTAFLTLCIISGGAGSGGECGGSWGISAPAFRGASGANYVIGIQESLQLSPGGFANQYGPGVSIVGFPGEARRLAGPALIDDTVPLEFRVFGEQGEHGFLFFSTGYDHRVLPWGGPLLVDISRSSGSQNWYYMGPIGPEGHVDAIIPNRDLPSFAHVKLHVTGITVSASGRFLTNSASPIILDSAW